MKENQNINKEDLRVIKTRRSLRVAILELSSKTSIDKVSVIDICDNALVNRMTFYKYYQDKFELFQDAIENTKAEILSGVNVKDDGSKEAALNYSVAVCDAIYRFYNEHIALIAGITQYNGPKLSTAIAETGIQALTKAFERKEGNLSSKYPSDLIAACVYGGFIGYIEYAMKNPNKFTSDAIRNYLTNLEDDIIRRNYNIA